MTRQEIFDKVAKHLLTQMKLSVIQGDCAYRGVGGLMCAIGCLISDADYSSEMDSKNMSIKMVLESYKGVPSIEALIPHEEMLMSLQHFHDRTMPGEWKTKLIQYAKMNKLNRKNIS